MDGGGGVSAFAAARLRSRTLPQSDRRRHHSPPIAAAVQSHVPIPIPHQPFSRHPRDSLIIMFEYTIEIAPVILIDRMISNHEYIPLTFIRPTNYN